MGECQPQWFTTEWSAVSGEGKGGTGQKSMQHRGNDEVEQAGFIYLLPLAPVVLSARAPVEKASK